MFGGGLEDLGFADLEDLQVLTEFGFCCIKGEVKGENMKITGRVMVLYQSVGRNGRAYIRLLDLDTGLVSSWTSDVVVDERAVRAPLFVEMEVDVGMSEYQGKTYHLARIRSLRLEERR